MDGRTFVFVGGKGGVGKTTVSSAFGLRCAEDGDRTLLVSTDPAHSTGDVFDQRFGDTPQPVEGHEGLDALELDPEEEVERHRKRLRRELGTQLSAPMVNEVDLQLEMAHRTPGAYEAALFDRFVEVMRSSEGYDRVVFDTSPTGGTLRLLALPELLEGWIERLIDKRERSIDLYEKAAIGRQTPRRVADGDPILERLEQRREKFAFAGETLREESSFVLVMNPDTLSLRETSRALDSLGEYGLTVGGVVVNKVTPEPDPHEEGTGAAYLRARCESERERIRQAREELEAPILAEIESRVRDVRGELLADVASKLDRRTAVGGAE